MKTLKWMVIVITFIVVVAISLAYLNKINFVDYHIPCLDSFADNFCKENGYGYGKAARLEFNNNNLNRDVRSGNPIIDCYIKDCDLSRDYGCDNKEYSSHKYLQNELDLCEAKQ